MHDIDRVRLEIPEARPSFEVSTLEAEQFEFEGSEIGEAGPVFGETESMELASGLLEAASEAELEQFIGNLISQAGRAVGGFVRSPEGNALASVLKGAVKQVLPAIGRSFGGSVGENFGARAAAAAGSAFGLELEGLSGEDREFEVARRYVDFAGEAVKNLVQGAPGTAPAIAANAAAALAAATHAPGLLRAPSPQVTPPASHATSGRWMRHGKKIVLFGV